ncbi:LOW QUALITY PROTEIN: uncharacterized protein ACDL77_013433 [Rhynchocyon petersi]
MATTDTLPLLTTLGPALSAETGRGPRRRWTHLSALLRAAPPQRPPVARAEKISKDLSNARAEPWDENCQPTRPGRVQNHTPSPLHFYLSPGRQQMLQKAQPTSLGLKPSLSEGHARRKPRLSRPFGKPRGDEIPPAAHKRTLHSLLKPVQAPTDGALHPFAKASAPSGPAESRKRAMKDDDSLVLHSSKRALCATRAPQAQGTITTALPDPRRLTGTDLLKIPEHSQKYQVTSVGSFAEVGAVASSGTPLKDALVMVAGNPDVSGLWGLNNHSTVMKSEKGKQSISNKKTLPTSVPQRPTKRKLPRDEEEVPPAPKPPGIAAAEDHHSQKAPKDVKAGTSSANSTGNPYVIPKDSCSYNWGHSLPCRKFHCELPPDRHITPVNIGSSIKRSLLPSYLIGQLGGGVAGRGEAGRRRGLRFVRRNMADPVVKRLCPGEHGQRIEWRKWKKQKKEEKKKWKDMKLMKKLERQRAHEEQAKLQEEEEAALQKEDRGRPYTLSVALPGSILDNAQSPELRTYLAGQIARACAIFCVDEIVVFDEEGQDAKSVEGEFMGVGKKGQACVQLARILQYLECPQYLRKAFFPKHQDLQFAGLLNPLDSPHHMRQDDESEFREGIVLDRPTRPDHGSFVNCGMKKEVKIDKNLEPGLRVTVRMHKQQLPESKTYRGKVVSSQDPRTKAGLYWAYSVRLASCLSAVFAEAPFKDGYDLTIGTSERGSDVASAQLPSFRHALVMFGGLQGLESGVDADPNLEVAEPSVLFDLYVNTCPNQGSRTIRTEEAILISLAALQPSLTQAGARPS